MQLTLGFIRSSSQVLIKELDWLQNKLDSRLIDTTDLEDYSLQGLFIGKTEHFEQLLGTLEKEKKYYPIMEAETFNLSYSVFEEMPAFQFKELSERVLMQWRGLNNFSAIEESFAFATHMRVLWHKDRMHFLEELWYWLKRNLACTELSLIFNDVIQSETKNEEGQKEAKPKLTQSLLSGSKIAHFMIGGGKEEALMSRYLDKWNAEFEVTEWDASLGRFVATVMIEKSPLMIMGRMTHLSQLQQSLLKGFFKAMQA
jgi:hypothetical protein